MKKIYKSKNDKVLSGLIGGIGEYFDVDPVLIRLAFVVVVFVTGFFPGVIAYIIGILIVPNSVNTPSELQKAMDSMKKEEKTETEKVKVEEKVEENKEEVEVKTETIEKVEEKIAEEKEENKEPVINL